MSETNGSGDASEDLGQQQLQQQQAFVRTLQQHSMSSNLQLLPTGSAPMLQPLQPHQQQVWQHPYHPSVPSVRWGVPPLDPVMSAAALAFQQSQQNLNYRPAVGVVATPARSTSPANVSAVTTPTRSTPPANVSGEGSSGTMSVGLATSSLTICGSAGTSANASPPSCSSSSAGSVAGAGPASALDISSPGGSSGGSPGGSSGGGTADAVPAKSAPEGLAEKRATRPNYEVMDLNGLKLELKRRAGEAKPVRWGPTDGDKTNRLSKLSKKDIVKILSSWDDWQTSAEVCPWYKSSDLKTPPKKKGKGRTPGGGASGDEDKEEAAALDRRRPSDLPRLIAIVFSEEFWADVCKSEQGSDNRSANKKESNLLKQYHPVLRKIAKAYVDEDWMDQGSFPSNPVDHRDTGDLDDDEMLMELDKLCDAMDAVDYIVPASRWSTILEDDAGDVDMVAAGVKFYGWWKFLRGELRVVRANEDLSGNHSSHSWKFCGKKVFNQLMLDFLDRAGGDNGNHFAKEYLNAELDDDSGASFNSLHDDGDEDTSEGDSGDEAGCRPKRKRKGAPGPRAAKKSTIMDALEKGSDNIKVMGEAMVAQLEKASQPSIGELSDQLTEAANRMDDLEEAIERMEEDPSCSKSRLARKKDQLEISNSTYKSLKAQHAKALAASST